MSARRLCGPGASTVLIALGALQIAGCETAAMKPLAPGFVGVGCYDHRGRFAPTVHTPGECAESTWVWRTEPWELPAPKP